MRNIVLTGMPGSGKTTVSKELLTILEGFSLVDIDEEIVKSEKRSINSIFETEGEGYFRDIETKMIKKYLNSENLILSTGGGAVERDENIGILKKIGVIIYLYCDFEMLLNRVEKDTNRPLLKVENQRERLQNLFERRDKKYRLADFTVYVSLLTPKEIAEKIVKEIGFEQN